MIKNLKLIKYKLIINILLLIILLLVAKNAFSVENRIIFKINQQAYTSLDFEKRIRYLDFIGNSNNLNKNIILDDFISANLFSEYYELSKKKIDFSEKINQIYNNVLETNKQNKKKFEFEINKENIIKNIKIDYIRKIVLEDILNSNLNKFNTSDAEIDLLYNIEIKYINFDLKNNLYIEKEINKITDINFNNLKNFLLNKNINFFTKQQEISNIKNVDKRIRENILLNNNYFINIDKNRYSYVFIERNFETYNGIIAHIFSIKSIDALSDNFLKCDNLINIKNSPNIINKEYKLSDLNSELKNNLININDYVKFFDNNENVYVVLCNLKFDLEILKNINLNKEININVKEIESKFIKKYSKIYNLIIIDA